MSLVHIDCMSTLRSHSFYEHPPFDLRRGVVNDSLHCLYLGVTLAKLNLWFGKDNHGEPFYIVDMVCSTKSFLLRDIAYHCIVH